MKWFGIIGLAVLMTGLVFFFQAPQTGWESKTPKTPIQTSQDPEESNVQEDLKQNPSHQQAVKSTQSSISKKKKTDSHNESNTKPTELSEEDISSITQLPSEVVRQMKEMEEEFKRTLRDKMVSEWGLSENNYDDFIKETEKTTKKIQELTQKARNEEAKPLEQWDEDELEKFENEILSLNESYETQLKKIFGNGGFDKFTAYREEFMLQMEGRYGNFHEPDSIDE